MFGWLKIIPAIVDLINLFVKGWENYKKARKERKFIKTKGKIKENMKKVRSSKDLKGSLKALKNVENNINNNTN